MCVVVVVDDFKVFDGFGLGRPTEAAVQVGLPCSFGVDSEVSGLVQFNAWGGKMTQGL